MSIAGKRVVVTRAPHQAAKLVNMLQDKGAIPLSYPCIDIAPPDDMSNLDAALRNLRAYDWLLFTSSNGVLAFSRGIDALQLKIDWTQIKIAVVGSSTAHAVEKLLGMKSDFLPVEQTGKTLAEMLPIHDKMRVLLPQSDIANPDTAQILRGRGVDVTVVTAYKTVIGRDGDDIPLLLSEKRIDAITFTSGSTIEGFVHRLAPLTPYDLPVACIGSSTVDVAESYGFETIIVPQQFTLHDMLAALDLYFAKTHA